jgi:hypothetical protein
MTMKQANTLIFVRAMRLCDDVRRKENHRARFLIARMLMLSPKLAFQAAADAIAT